MLFNLKDVDLIFSHPVWLPATLMVLTVLFSFFVYRFTNPPVSRPLRRLLAILRGAALVLILLVLFQTIFNLLYRKSRPPILAVAVDQSASMTLEDLAGERSKQLRTILASDTFRNLEDTFELVFYPFANTPGKKPLPDSLTFPGDQTDITTALEQIQNDHLSENLNGILLMSDGNYNEGGNPVRAAEKSRAPIYTVPIGSPEPIPDIAIADIQSNAFAYVGEETPIQVTVRATGLRDRTINLELYSETGLEARQPLSVETSPAEETVELAFTPKQPGRQRMSLRLPAQNEEKATENNRRDFYIDIFKSKVQIMLIAGTPSPDVSFLRRALAGDRFEIISLIQKTRNQFYQPPPDADSLAAIDMFVLLDFPNAATPAAFRQRLEQSLRQKARPLLFIPGPLIQSNLFAELAEFTPVQSFTKRGAARTVLPELGFQGASHPVLQISDTPAASRTLWQQLPPIFSSLAQVDLWPDATTPATAVPETGGGPSLPLVVLRNRSGQKSAAVPAHQLWRWSLTAQPATGTDVLDKFIGNLVRWLETQDSDQNVRVQLPNSQFSFGEPVEMDIEVFDETLEPRPEARVTVELQHEGDTTELEAQPSGGAFELMLQPSRSGEYRATVTAVFEGRTLGTVEVRFSVGEYTAELSDLQANHNVLQSISRVSGGWVIPPDSLRILQTLQGRTLTTTEQTSVELWNHRLVLLVIILVLSVEWIIRKRRGML